MPCTDFGVLIDKARSAISAIEAAEIGISRLPNLDGFSARILTRDAVAMRAAMQELWSVTRVALTGETPVSRRK